MNKKLIRLTEADLHRIVRESVNKVLRESEDEFEYGDSVETKPNTYRQVIIYKGKEIGFLFYKEKNWLAPIEETYLLPDIEYGMSEPTLHLSKGKKGWIDFKRFNEYESAFAYAKQNFEELAYLFEYGDYD